MNYCNALSKGLRHCCEREAGHPGKHWEQSVKDGQRITWTENHRPAAEAKTW